MAEPKLAYHHGDLRTALLDAALEINVLMIIIVRSMKNIVADVLIVSLILVWLELSLHLWTKKDSLC